MSDDGLLAGLTVLDLSENIAGAYCTRLLAGLGATVTMVEPPVGSAVRRLGPFPEGHAGDRERGCAHLYFNAGKRSTVLDLSSVTGREQLLALLPSAHVIVDSMSAARAREWRLDAAVLRAVNLALTVTSITPWGRTGPYADLPGDELTVQAASGFASMHGEPPREPLRFPGWQMECFAGTYAAIAIIGAALQGGGRAIDVGVFEATMCAMESRLSSWEYTGRLPKRALASFDVYYPLNIWPCAEGSVVMPFYAPRDWEALAVALGDEELRIGDAFRTPRRRVRNRAAVDARLGSLLSTHAARDVFDLTRELRCSLGMVLDAAELITNPHVVARGSMVEVEHPVAGRYAMPSAPFLTSECAWRDAPAPTLGQHQTAQVTRPPISPDAPNVDGGTFAPLEGLRILDLTTAWAGPSATRVLGALGADVLKIEACSWYDAWRGPVTSPPPGTGNYADNDPGTLPHERTPLFGTANRNKRGIALDLTRGEGLDVFHRLVERSDVVLSNFSSRVLPNLQLDYERLRAINPRIIVLAMPAYGGSGPYEHAVAYGNTMEAMAGISARFGYADGQPQITNDLTYGDPVAGAHAAVAVMAALVHRQRTGRGLSIDVSQHETLLAQGGEAIVKFSLDGTVLPRLGARDHTFAPQGYYRCAGDDAWVAIAVHDDASWRALCGAIADPALDDARFVDHAGRLKHHDEIDGILGRFTATRDKREVARLLATAGIAAAPVLTFEELRDDSHVKARAAFELVEHPVAGARMLPRVPIMVDGAPVSTTRHAPMFGQHSGDVFTDLLGMSKDEIAALALAGVTGDAPQVRAS